MGPLKIVLIILGSVSLILGIIGIFIPGLPTTPFLILTSALYLRSSNRLYNLLITNKYLGRPIKSFHENKGMTVQLKIYSIVFMWIMISISVYYINSPVRYIVLCAGIVGTIIMGFIIPTALKKE